MDELKLTDCDVLVAATLATISLAPRQKPDPDNAAYVERAMEAFDELLFRIAQRGGTETMRAEAARAAEAMLKG